MISLENNTKQEIINHLVDNELKDIQKRFYSFIDENRYNIIHTLLDAIFTEDLYGANSVEYIGSSKFEEFSVVNMFNQLKRHFSEIDYIDVVANEKQRQQRYLGRHFNALHEIFLGKDLMMLIDPYVHIAMGFKIKNRWYSFIIDRNKIDYKPYKKYR